MNSNFLMGTHKDTYKKFFDKYDLIISSPICFPIIGDTSMLGKGNGFLISQKLPLRNYVGINLGKKMGEIEFIFKEGEKKEFKKGNIENFYKIDKDILKDIGLDYDIGFLSEYNWNEPSSIIANILLAILIINKELTIGEIKELDIENTNYKKILEKVMMLDKKLLEKFNFFSNIRNNSGFIGSTLLKSNNHLLCTLKDNKSFYKNIGNNKDFNDLDLTISLINTNSFINNNFNSNFIVESEKSINSFKDELGIDSLNISLVDTLDNLSKFYSLQVFRELHMLYNNTTISNKFFVDVHAYRRVLKSIFKSFGGNFIDIKKLREILLSYIPYNYINFFIDQVGACGESKLLVLSNKTGLFDEELLIKINQSIGLNLSLDYSSFFDGYERHGSRIEQYKTMELYSKFSKGLKVTKYSNGELSEENIERKELMLVKETILMFKKEKTILYNGNAITSKDLKSQSYTLDLFNALFTKGLEEISNSDLPQSSYSKCKNELIGKIIIPLKNLIKNKIGKNIEIDCYGKNDDFNIKFITSEVNIIYINN